MPVLPTKLRSRDRVVGFRVTAATPGAGAAGASYSSGTSMPPLLGQIIGAKSDEITERFPDRLSSVDCASGRRWPLARASANPGTTQGKGSCRRRPEAGGEYRPDHADAIAYTG